MKHAGAEALRQLQPLIDALRELAPLRERRPGTFYRGGSAFLHFHEDPAGLFADAKIDGRAFTRFSVDTEDDREALLRDVRSALENSPPPVR